MVGVIVDINLSVCRGRESAIHLIRDWIRNQIRPDEVKLAQPHFGRSAGGGGILIGGRGGLGGGGGKGGRRAESRGGQREGGKHPDLHGGHPSANALLKHEKC